MGDLEIRARYRWATVGSRFNHVAGAFDAGFPFGRPERGLGEGLARFRLHACFTRINPTGASGSL